MEIGFMEKNNLEINKRYKTFEEFFDALNRSATYCPWTRNVSITERAHHIAGEAKELAEAAEKKDYENLKEECGDVLWDVFMLINFAEKESFFTRDNVLQCVVEKMKRRKPFVFEGRYVTIDEAWQVWDEGRKKEGKAVKRK